MFQTSRTYREILQEKLESRCRKNPRYSLRSFARDLGVSAPRLSKVLNGHHGLSESAAREIARKLNLSAEESDLFCALVQSEHARAAAIRKLAKQKVSELTQGFSTLSLDSFRVISDWYHFAILELTLVAGFKSDAGWISAQLGISRIEAQSAIERLVRLDLLEVKDGVLRQTGSNFVNPQGLPSDAVRKFHSQILDRAKQSLEFQTTEEREFSNLTIAIDEEKLPLARKMICELTQKFNSELSSGSNKTRVYNLSVQFFGLQERPNQSNHNPEPKKEVQL